MYIYVLCRQKCPIPRTNKRFLNTVVAGAMATNKRMKLQQQKKTQYSREHQTDKGGTSDSWDKHSLCHRRSPGHRKLKYSSRKEKRSRHVAHKHSHALTAKSFGSSDKLKTERTTGDDRI